MVTSGKNKKCTHTWLRVEKRKKKKDVSYCYVNRLYYIVNQL